MTDFVNKTSFVLKYLYENWNQKRDAPICTNSLLLVLKMLFGETGVADWTDISNPT